MRMMASISILVIVASIFLNVAESAKCPKPADMKSFDIPRVSGRWFHQFVSVNGLEMPQIKCTSRNITVLDKGNIIIRLNYADIDTGIVKNVDQTLYHVPNTVSTVKVKDVYINELLTAVDSDYENYFVFYGCLGLDYCRGSFVVAMSRERHMSLNVKNKLEAVLRKAKLTAGIVPVDQINCEKQSFD